MLLDEENERGGKRIERMRPKKKIQLELKPKTESKANEQLVLRNGLGAEW